MEYFHILGDWIIHYVIFQSIHKSRELMKKLKVSENSYRDLTKKYEAAKILKQDLEIRTTISGRSNKERQKDYILIQATKTCCDGRNDCQYWSSMAAPLNSLSLLIQDVREGT